MNRKFLLVGLTGGIGTGKSMVSRLFRDLGCLIIDADLLRGGGARIADLIRSRLSSGTELRSFRSGQGRGIVEV